MNTSNLVSRYWWLVGGLLVVSIGVCIYFFSRYSRRISVVDRPKVQFEIPKDKIKKVVLSNGMTVLVFQNKQVPKVLVQIAYDVGSSVEEEGERKPPPF